MFVSRNPRPTVFRITENVSNHIHRDISGCDPERNGFSQLVLLTAFAVLTRNIRQIYVSPYHWPPFSMASSQSDFLVYAAFVTAASKMKFFSYEYLVDVIHKLERIRELVENLRYLSGICQELFWKTMEILPHHTWGPGRISIQAPHMQPPGQKLCCVSQISGALGRNSVIVNAQNITMNMNLFSVYLGEPILLHSLQSISNWPLRTWNRGREIAGSIPDGVTGIFH